MSNWAPRHGGNPLGDIERGATAFHKKQNTMPAMHGSPKKKIALYCVCVCCSAARAYCKKMCSRDDVWEML
jgi:hypothetical protein